MLLTNGEEILLEKYAISMFSGPPFFQRFNFSLSRVEIFAIFSGRVKYLMRINIEIKKAIMLFRGMSWTLHCISVPPKQWTLGIFLVGTKFWRRSQPDPRLDI